MLQLLAARRAAHAADDRGRSMPGESQWLRGPAALLVVAAVALAGCSNSSAGPGSTTSSLGSSTTTTTSSPAPTSTTPVPAGVEKIYLAMVASVRRATSVHYVATSKTTTSGGTNDLHFITSVGASAGVQVTTWTESGETGTFTIIAIGSTTYLQADADSLATFFEAVPAADASTYAGKWISFTPSDAPYKSLHSGDFTIGSLVASLKFLPTAATTKARTIVITGKPSPTTTVPAGEVATAITTISRSTKRPISQLFNVSYEGNTARSSVVFSQWDTATVPTAPSGAITWASVAAAIATTTTSS
ncbi:MAG: hypothetical protein ABSB54_06735 [Acidimicrobiales bacterium]